ncbi:hypothetical protein G3O06_31260 [Burkholderia sp. Ac-20345]|uniref:hypothetical protein n=1 Tax=Burkholderia sp. Ac-20345 TaxID=2703891 RepID=UPI00197C5113|nr:hypothetical protein [Burkholderia sp. Ac-20345]MBN3781983.1 hypothetical protein [Burkholderia sp. Ac-20345]
MVHVRGSPFRCLHLHAVREPSCTMTSRDAGTARARRGRSAVLLSVIETTLK